MIGHENDLCNRIMLSGAESILPKYPFRYYFRLDAFPYDKAAADSNVYDLVLCMRKRDNIA